MAKKTTAILIQPRSAKEKAFIEGLLERLGFTSHALSEEEVLDLGLSRMLHEVDRSKRVAPKLAAKILAS